MLTHSRTAWSLFFFVSPLSLCWFSVGFLIGSSSTSPSVLSSRPWVAPSSRAFPLSLLTFAAAFVFALVLHSLTLHHVCLLWVPLFSSMTLSHSMSPLTIKYGLVCILVQILVTFGLSSSVLLLLLVLSSIPLLGTNAEATRAC